MAPHRAYLECHRGKAARMASRNEEVQIRERVKHEDIFKVYLGNLLYFVQNSDLMFLKLELEQNDQFPYDLDLALFIAVVQSFEKAVDLLLDAGAFINARTDAGVTPLYYALNRPKMQRLLLEKGADPNIQSNGGDTILHYAVYQNRPEDVKLLLENGANADLENDEGLTPLDVALDNEDHRMINMLRYAVNDSERYIDQLAEYDLNHELHRRPRIRARKPVIVQRTALQFGSDAAQDVARFL